MPELMDDWSEIKRRLQTRFPGLTDQELDDTNGDRDGVIALLELRLGYGHQNAEVELDRLLREEETPASRS